MAELPFLHSRFPEFLFVMNALNLLLTRIERARLWGYFHKDWLLQIRGILRPQLPPEFFLFVESETLLISPDEPAGTMAILPDVSVARPDGTRSPEASVESATTATGVLEVDEPCEAFTQYSLLIRRAPENIVVAALELLSPSNKAPGNRFDRERHLRKRAALLDAGVSLMEIDALREGDRELPSALRRLDSFDRVWWTAFHTNGNRRLRGWGWNETDPLPVVRWRVEGAIEVSVDLAETCRLACEFNRWESLVASAEERPSAPPP